MFNRSINTILRLSKRPVGSLALADASVPFRSEGKLFPDSKSATAAMTAAAAPSSLLKNTDSCFYSFDSLKQVNYNYSFANWNDCLLAKGGIVKPVPLAATPAVPWNGRPLPFLREVSLECEINETVNEMKEIFSEWLKEFLPKHVKAFNDRKAEKEKTKTAWSAVLSKSLKKAVSKRERIDKDDKCALNDYTSNGFGSMNNHQRGIHMDDDSLPRRVAAVVRALGKAKLKRFRGTVYRRLFKMKDDFIKGLRVGATFADKAFLSTSKLKSFVDDKEGDGPGKVCFEIESRSGADVKMYSRHPKEEEVLFLSGTLFMITDVRIGKYGAVRVKMYELY